MTGTSRTIVLTAALALSALLLPAPAAAHCDSMDGPVVKAAQRALEAGAVQLALVWVRTEDEAEIRAAFARTLRVRAQGSEARELADRWFYETLVRVHRMGEGAPYTGLKPAGSAVPAGIAAADRALETGSLATLSEDAVHGLAQQLEERFTSVRRLAGYDPLDVDAGRRYVHTYVEFIHFVEELHALLHGDAGLHEAEGGGRAG